MIRTRSAIDTPGLRAIRYVALACGTVLASWCLRFVTPEGVNIALAVVFAIAFLLGLRVRAALGVLGIGDGKEMSWGPAFATAFLLVTTFIIVLHVRPIALTYLTLLVEILGFYIIGKATCFLSGCCTAARRVLPNFPLPIIEIALTAGGLLLAASLQGFGVTAMLVALLFVHLVTRLLTRLLRAQRMSSLWSVEIVALVALLVIVPFQF